METVCKHCERRPAVTGLGLCARCNAVRGIRKLYLRTRRLTPEQEDHLLMLAERAKNREPLFQEDDL